MTFTPKGDVVLGITASLDDQEIVTVKLSQLTGRDTALRLPVREALKLSDLLLETALSLRPGVGAPWRRKAERPHPEAFSTR
jgi:hypothetical protein